jgi:hypothetical protein
MPPALVGAALALVSLGAALSGVGTLGYLRSGDEFRAQCFDAVSGEQMALCDQFLQSERWSLNIAVVGAASAVGGVILLAVARYLSRRASSGRERTKSPSRR